MTYSKAENEAGDLVMEKGARFIRGLSRMNRFAIYHLGMTLTAPDLDTLKNAVMNQTRKAKALEKEYERKMKDGT